MQGSLVSFHGWAPAVVVAIVVAVVVVVAVGRSPFNFELFGATSPLPTSEHREHIVVSNLLQTSSSLGPRRTSRGDARRGNPLGQKIPRQLRQSVGAVGRFQVALFAHRRTWLDDVTLAPADPGLISPGAWQIRQSFVARQDPKLCLDE